MNQPAGFLYNWGFKSCRKTTTSFFNYIQFQSQIFQKAYCMKNILWKLWICFGMKRLFCYLKWWTQYVKLKGICPCYPCNMLNMLDSSSTFSTCFYPVSRTDEHGRKQINFEYILQWGPLRVPHDSWIKPKFKFFQKFSRFWLIFKIFEVFNLSSFKSTTFILNFNSL